MSLVGPRPEEVWLVKRYGETERFRLEMRPGITGPMQVHGRGELTFQERLAVEREYVENYRFEKDVRILMRTVSTIFRGPRRLLGAGWTLGLDARRNFAAAELKPRGPRCD